MKKPDVSRVLSPSDLKQLRKARAVKRSFFPPVLTDRQIKLKHSEFFAQLTYHIQWVQITLLHYSLVVFNA